jgi:uncharacterized protein YcbK (DUF882 family)
VKLDDFVVFHGTCSRRALARISKDFGLMKFVVPAVCLAGLLVGLGIDFAICRDASVLAKLNRRGTAVANANPVTPPRSPIVITPLPDSPATLALHKVNGAEVASFTIPADGQADAETARALKHFLRCQRTGREHPIAPGLLAMLVSVARQWPGRMLDVVSAFRAPPFGTLHSKHFTGHAIDFRVEGVKTSKLRDFIWAKHHEVGVGYYLQENFVHMDWRPGEPDYAWSSDHEGDAPESNPRWAYAARHPSPPPVCENGCS